MKRRLLVRANEVAAFLVRRSGPSQQSDAGGRGLPFAVITAATAQSHSIFSVLEAALVEPPPGHLHASCGGGLDVQPPHHMDLVPLLRSAFLLRCQLGLVICLRTHEVCASASASAWSF